MKIVFPAISNLADVRSGSGTWFHLAAQLERSGHAVTRIGPVPLQAPLPTRLCSRLNRMCGKHHPLFLDPFVGRLSGAWVAAQLRQLSCDLFLTNDMALAAFTPTPHPVVLYTDVMLTPDYREKHLPGCRLGGLSPLSLWLVRRTFRAALRRAALCVFPAPWAAQAALAYHPAPEKIAVVPFGANVADPGPAPAQARSLDRLRAKDCLDLLFVGKDWLRKGGHIAVETVAELNRQGLPARLHFVGCIPPEPVAPAQVVVHGLLDKANPDQAARLAALYRQCDAFLLPSSSEGFVISVLEAAAYGLPALAYDTLGVNSAVLHMQTGTLLPLGSPASHFAGALARWREQPALYQTLACGARNHFEATANWPACVGALMQRVNLRLAELRSPAQPGALAFSQA